MVTINRHGSGGQIAELVLDRPAAMNAVSTQLARDLAAACAELSAEESVRVVLVTSSSAKAFCVGADLVERSSFTDADLMAQRPVARAAYAGVLNLPMPTIAVVEGFALGGGLEIGSGGLSWPPRSRRTHRSGCARPSAPCGLAAMSTW